MQPRAGVEQWRELPIFKQLRKNKPWGKSSYKDAWTKTLAATLAARPDLRPELEHAERDPETGEVLETELMWFRDMRKVFKARMVKANAQREVHKILMGHALDVADDYLELDPDRNWELAEKATRSLDLGDTRASQQEVG